MLADIISSMYMLLFSILTAYQTVHVLAVHVETFVYYLFYWQTIIYANG